MIATKINGARPRELKERLSAIKAQLPAGVRALIIEELPEYDTARGAKRIDNVLAGRSSDEAITVFLESLVQPAAIAA